MVEFRQKLDANKSMALLKHQFKRMIILFVILSVLFVAIGGFYIALAVMDGESIAVGLFLVIFGVLFTPLVMLISIPLQKSMTKSMSIISGDTSEVYTFDDEKISISVQKGEDYSSQTTAKYSYIFGVDESKTHYFIYISKQQAHVLEKSAITEGDLNELDYYFSVHLGRKYRKLNK